MDFLSNLEKKMNEKNLNKSQLAKGMGVAPSTVNSWFNRSAENILFEIKNGAPFDLRDLKIKGDDIIKNNPQINLENLDDLLDKVLFLTALSPKMNNKQDLLVLANKVINSKRDYYLEK